MAYRIEPLTKRHLRKDFECGKERLDDYIRKQARQDVKNEVAICQVLVDDDNVVLGYYTLCNSSIPRGDVPDGISRKLPKYSDLPVTLLGRLALDKSVRGKGLGEKLIMHAFYNCAKVAETLIASWAVIVDPIDEDAKRFYAHFDFLALQDSQRMYLPMRTISQAFKFD